MNSKELSEAVISVSRAYHGNSKLELRSSIVTLAWEPNHSEHCMVFQHLTGIEFIIAASSIEYIVMSPNAIRIKLSQVPARRLTAHLYGNRHHDLSACNTAIILYLNSFEESKYARFKFNDQFFYGDMKILQTIFETRWAPYREQKEFEEDSLGYMNARLDIHTQSFVEFLSKRTFEFAFSHMESINDNPICKDIENLSIIGQAKDEGTIVEEDIIDIMPVSNGINRLSNEIGKQTNGQQVNIVEEPAEGEILVKYPSNKGGVDVHLRDMCRLPYTEMLNDTNIELGMKKILEKNGEFSQSCYVYNTYFFGKLAQDGQRINFRLPRIRKQWIQANYRSVKRWTRKVDVFEKEHIVVPINTELHWCVVIIKNPKALLVPEGEVQTSKEPCLYIMLDSIPDSDEIRALGSEIMLDYLEMEFEDKKKKNSNLVFCRDNMKKVIHKHNPVQKNLVDCGVFLLAFLEQYVTKLPTFSQNYEIDWTEYSPFFEISRVKYYREKLIKFIKNLAGETRWSRLEEFERIRYGVTNPSLESRVEAARKPRAHSFCMGDWRQQEISMSKKKGATPRAHSNPSRTDLLISCKPIVITRGENGGYKCPSF